MTLIIKQIISLIRLLHSENGTHQIVWGITLGCFLGFAPLISIQALFVLLILLVFNIQFGAAFISAFAFKFIAYLFDPVADQFGQFLLEHPDLKNIWTTLYNTPLVPFTRFNNSIVMGSLIVSLILSPIIYILSFYLIKKYREVIVKKVSESKTWKAFMASKIYFWYKKYEELGY